MDFKEWLKKHEREVFKRNQGCFGQAYVFGAKNGFKAGQQSKQAEVDKRLSDYQLEVSQVGQACVKWKEIAEGKQAEIEGLEKKLKYEKSAYRNIKLQFLNKQDDLDELQAEIEALKNKMQTALNKACMLQNSSGERIYTELKEILK